VILSSAVSRPLDAADLVPELTGDVAFITIAGTVGAIVGAIVMPKASLIFGYSVTRASFPRVVGSAVIGAWIGNLIVVALNWELYWLPTVILGAIAGLLVAFAFKRSSRFQKIVEIAVAAAACFMLVWNCGTAYQDYVDPQGDKNADCDKFEISPIRNTSGLVVTAHRTSCDPDGVLGAVTTQVYVYVHPIGKQENRKCLIFRYLVDDENAPAPEIKWKNDHELTIRVKQVDADKMLSSFGSVTIEYYFDKPYHRT
jgi:hypothetical protein